jgi:hypothetical protein
VELPPRVAEILPGVFHDREPPHLATAPVTV